MEGKGQQPPLDPAVESGEAQGVVANAAASPSAVVTVPLFGGNRGGRPRKDNLVPGSPEAIQADKDADAKRKRDWRAERSAARMANQPPALPSAVAPPLDAAQAGAVGPVVDVVAPGVPAVPWQAETLKPLFDELIEVAEEHRVEKFVEKCQQANLPEKLVKEVGKDAHYTPVAKRGLSLALPKVAAKWLNKSVISSEYEPEATLATALTAVMMQSRKLNAKLDKCIAEMRAQEKKP